MGKHSHLKGVLPRQVGHEPPEGEESNWNDEVVKQMKEYEAELQTKEQIAAKYSAKREEKDKVSAEEKRIAVHVEALERILIKRLEEDGATGISLPGWGFSLKDEPTASVTNVDDFLKFIRENGMEHLLTVHANTRKAIAVERFNNGIPETPGLALKLRTTIDRRKKK